MTEKAENARGVATVTRFVSVKNWQKFQHQSERRLPWIKLFTSLLEPTRDPAYSLLPDVSKVLLHHIWLMARVFNNRIPEDWLTREKLNLQTKVNLDSLLDAGFISYCSESSNDSSSLACAHRASQSLLVSSQNLTEEEKGSGEKPTDTEFDALWRDYPRKRGKDKAQAHFRASVTSRADLAAVRTAVANYRREIDLLAVEERYVLHGSTFFNGRWKDYTDGVWVPPKTGSKGGPRPFTPAPHKPE